MKRITADGGKVNMLNLDRTKHYLVIPILVNGGTSHQCALLSVGGEHYIVDSSSTITIYKLTVYVRCTCVLNVRSLALCTVQCRLERLACLAAPT